MEAVAAAQRITGLLEEAKGHGHYTNGWYFYLDRRDVERVCAAVLRFADVDEGRTPDVRQEARAEVVRPEGTEDVAGEPVAEESVGDIQLRLTEL